MNNNIEKSKDLFPFRIVSETPTGDGYVDCVWEMPVWVIEKLEAEAKKRKITISDLVTLILKTALKEKQEKKNEITEKDVKRLWVEKDAVCVELKDGRIGRELIRDYEPLRKATRKQLENCRVDCDGVWFDDLDEGLELSGFFSPKKTNPIGRVFWLFPELNASAFARRLGIPQPLFAAYVNGTKKPSSARKKLIDEELRRIGKELLKTVA